MSNSRALYEQVILDHNKKPRNFEVMEQPDYKVEGFNPLCGDQFTIYIKVDGGMISEVSFQGTGCAISKSSASVMTTLLKGKSIENAKSLFEQFHEMITSGVDTPLDDQALGKLRVFSGIREYPMRAKCATLAWHAMMSALDEDADVSISTE
jgi:nitrogen fixation NifU-like protein